MVAHRGVSLPEAATKTRLDLSIVPTDSRTKRMALLVTWGKALIIRPLMSSKTSYKTATSKMRVSVRSKSQRTSLTLTSSLSRPCRTTIHGRVHSKLSNLSITRRSWSKYIMEAWPIWNLHQCRISSRQMSSLWTSCSGPALDSL